MQLKTLHKMLYETEIVVTGGRRRPENGKRLKGAYRVILLIVNNHFISKKLIFFEKVVLRNI